MLRPSIHIHLHPRAAPAGWRGSALGTPRISIARPPSAPRGKSCPCAWWCRGGHRHHRARFASRGEVDVAGRGWRLAGAARPCAGAAPAAGRVRQPIRHRCARCAAARVACRGPPAAVHCRSAGRARRAARKAHPRLEVIVWRPWISAGNALARESSSAASGIRLAWRRAPLWWSAATRAAPGKSQHGDLRVRVRRVHEAGAARQGQRPSAS